MSYSIEEAVADARDALAARETMAGRCPRATQERLPDGTRIWVAPRDVAVTPNHVHVAVAGRYDLGERRHEALFVVSEHGPGGPLFPQDFTAHPSLIFNAMQAEAPELYAAFVAFVTKRI